ncbi:prepilin-type N-terminal cleavage/methylation domain-containing protein [Pseudothermotoga sp.]
MSKLTFSSKSGFTLIELLIVLIILSVVFAIISMLFYLPIRNAQFTQQEYTTFEEMRKVLEILRKELTLAKDAEATTTLIEEITPTATELAFGYDNGKFYVKTSTNLTSIAKLSLSSTSTVFFVETVNSPPPKPKKYVKVTLIHENPTIKLETTIGLLNSFQLENPGTQMSGNTLIVTKNK